MHETAIPMGKMLHTFLAIHGRCKFIIFLRGQTLSLSAPTLILSLMEHFEGKAKNTAKYTVKSTFCRSIQINCNWLPGNPQPSPYIYIHMYLHVLYICRQRVTIGVTVFWVTLCWFLPSTITVVTQRQDVCVQWRLLIFPWCFHQFHPGYGCDVTTLNACWISSGRNARWNPWTSSLLLGYVYCLAKWLLEV